MLYNNYSAHTQSNGSKIIISSLRENKLKKFLLFQTTIVCATTISLLQETSFSQLL